jgi:hypothetical protein
LSKQTTSIGLGAIIHQNGQRPGHTASLLAPRFCPPQARPCRRRTCSPDGSGDAAAVDEVADDHKMEGTPLLSLGNREPRSASSRHDPNSAHPLRPVATPCHRSSHG